MCIAFAGYQLDRSKISYSLPGNKINNLMGVFSALGTIAFTFGDTLLPEIQVCSDIYRKLVIMPQGSPLSMPNAWAAIFVPVPTDVAAVP